MAKCADAAAFVSAHYPVLRNNSFAEMTTPALVVAGDKDKNINFSERDDWRADAYHLSPGSKCLLTILGGEHILGGISGYDVAETTHDSPERVALVQKLTLAYLRTALFPGDSSWADAQSALCSNSQTMARIECK